jgi:phosphatidylserine decarboxylase
MKEPFNYIIHAKETLIVPILIYFLGFLLHNPYLYILSLITIIFLLFFFRKYNGPFKCLTNNNILISPTQGKIINMSQKNNILRISIFLNIHNIHVQYYPIDGLITNIYHKSGSFHPASILKKSNNNERIETTISTPFGNIIIYQIAGLIARRIVSFDYVGKTIKKGTPMGLIKLGSRVDLLVPTEKIKSIFISNGNYIEIGSKMIEFF